MTPSGQSAVASLTVSEKVKIISSRRQHKENERDCRTIVQQLVSSIPHEVLTSTSYGPKERGNDTQKKKAVTFVDQDKESEKVERNLVQDCLSGETNGEKSRRVQDQHPGQGSFSGESDVDEKVTDEKQDLENKVLFGSDGCEESTELTQEMVQTPSQTLQQITILETQELTPTQTGTHARDRNCQNWRSTHY